MPLKRRAKGIIVTIMIVGSVLMYPESQSMEAEQFTDESPITTEQIEAAQEPRKIRALTPGLACDLKNNPEDLSESYFWDIYQTPYATKEGKDENLTYMDKLHLYGDRGEGNIRLFRGNNLAIITKDIYSGPINVSSQEPGYLSSILYYIFKFSENIFSKNLDQKFCYICSIETKETEQRKGYARFALTQLIETTFTMSSVSFISALISEFNYSSQCLFKSLEFIKYDKMLSLDGGVTLILPSRSSSEGNYYLSRFDWEKRRSEDGQKTL